MIKRIKLWWKKKNNYLTSEEAEIINNQVQEFKNSCEETAKAHNKDESDRYKRLNYTCPHCRNNDATEIVDKIQHVQGSGSVSGNLFGISGKSSIDTNEIRNCNKCGHQWKKPKMNYKWSSDYLKSFLVAICDYIRYEGKYDKVTIDTLNEKGFYAETMYALFMSDEVYIDSYKMQVITKDSLREIFKSIHDENIPRSIQTSS